MAALSGGLLVGDHDVADAARPAATRMVESMRSIVRGSARPGKAAAQIESESRAIELQAEADVHGAGGVGDGAGGDEIGAGLRVGAHGFESDAAGEFDLGAAGDLADPLGGFGGREIVEQEMGGAAVERFAQFGAGADFDFDRAGRAARARSMALAHSAGGGDVVVLDQNRVVEAHAVVGDAAGGGGRLLQARAGRAWSCGYRGRGSSVPATASANWRASVATPLRRCRKFSATRSHSSSVRARPRDLGDDLAVGAAIAVAACGASCRASARRRSAASSPMPARISGSRARKRPRRLAVRRDAGLAW